MQVGVQLDALVGIYEWLTVLFWAGMNSAITIFASFRNKGDLDCVAVSLHDQI